ncbi:MAG TPA: bifunctional oligoribonuclease/PAP phosphatase NrnA, partial [Saprospiraceae bacterium]|nr:bifunctional oligoribonuclease/PAP phosphatase NrnA [Saprospiraceae bacterium]
LDFNDLSRVGDDMQKTLETFPGVFIMIDHHQQPTDVATYLFSDTSICATAQMVYHFLELIKDENAISKDMATCLYTGILTDTGSFRLPNTSPTTLRIAAKLIEKGAKNARIYNNIYDTNSYNRLQLLGQALQNLKVVPKYKTAYITISEEEKRKYNFQKGDTEGVVNYALYIKGIVFGVIFIEDSEQKIIKISFRSKGHFSVNQFARNHFEGGGHDNAAGGKSNLSMSETVLTFLELLPEYQEALAKSDEI